MVSCIVCGCSRTGNHTIAGITLHRFPKNPEIRDKWIEFTEKTGWMPNSNSTLCSQHFAAECFDRTSQLIVRLRANSVPTIRVNRKKYGKTFNTEGTDCGLPSRPSLLPPVPKTEETKRSFHKLHTDSPREKHLKTIIQKLHQADIAKSLKIRNLQKVVWRQKKQICSLKTMLNDLQGNSLVPEILIKEEQSWW